MSIPYKQKKAAVQWMIINKSTLRTTGRRFHIDKSTLHRFIHRELVQNDPQMYEMVCEVMKVNWDYKHLVGGNVSFVRKVVREAMERNGE